MSEQINDCIKVPFAHICNRYFNTGIFHGELKVANVVPIIKSGDEMLFSNYIPVSVLPLLSTIFERLMYNRLTMYVYQNEFLIDYSLVFKRKNLPTYQ